MKENQIILTHGNNYSQMVREIVQVADLDQMIEEKAKKKGMEKIKMCIGIKPNLVLPSPADFGATTHPEIVGALIACLKEQGYSNIKILEGSWVGDRTLQAIEICGYSALCQQYDIPFVDMQKENGLEKLSDGLKIHICAEVEQIDYLINVPVMKGHCQTRMTCALKNMKGLIPNTEKRRFHQLGLHKPIACLNAIIKQDFVLVDSICGDLEVEDGGNPVKQDRIFAAIDPVLCDSYACQLMNLKAKDVPYIVEAESLGVGSTDLKQAEIITLHPQTCEPKVSISRNVLELAQKVEEVDSCSACYGTMIPVLGRLKQEGLLDALDTKIKIGQGYRKKTGKLGIGSCTGCFEYSLKGCPPEEEEIYQFLKRYIGKETL